MGRQRRQIGECSRRRLLNWDAQVDVTTIHTWSTISKLPEVSNLGY